MLAIATKTKRLTISSMVFALTVVSLHHLGAVVVEPQMEPLFTDVVVGAEEQLRPPSVPAMRSRPVQLNPRLFERGQHGLRRAGAVWLASLFPDAQVTLRVRECQVKGERRFVCIGQADAFPGSQMILAAVDGIVVGSLTLPGKGVYRLEYGGSGFHWLSELDSSRRPRCGLELRERLGLADAAPEARDFSPEKPGTAMTDDDGSGLSGPLRPMGGNGSEPNVVDFLVTYTEQALEGAGGEAGIQALIDFIIAEANTAYANSNIDLRWSIVYQDLTSYTDSGRLGDDWNWLRNDTEVAQLRDAYAADLVLMIVELEEEGWGGIAGYSASVFVRSDINAGFYLVTHEVGHLLGAGHDHLTCDEYGSSNCGNTYPYSYGHRLVGEECTYITIMSYEPGVVIPYFSNPNVSFLGTATGVAEGEPLAADNARTINEELSNAVNRRTAANRFELNAGAYEAAETGQLSVNILRSGDPSITSSVLVVTVSDTAVAGQDFEPISQQLTFSSGEVSKAVSLTFLADAETEGPEQFVIVLSEPSAGTALGLNHSATVTILDDEPGLRFASDRVTVVESESRVEVVVQRTGRITEAASVLYEVVGETARVDTDFGATTGRLEFAAGEPEQVVVISLLDDEVPEADETFRVNLSEPMGALLATPASGMVHILDDDRSGSLDLTFPQDTSPNGPVLALALQPDGRIICGGRFTEVGGTWRTALVRYLPDGRIDSEFAPAEFRNSQSAEAQVQPALVSRIEVQADGKVLVVGSFAAVNGHVCNHIARLMPNGSVDTTFAPAPGPDSPVWDVLQQPDGKILIAGSFRSVSGWASGLVARLNADGSVDRSFLATPRPESGAAGSIILDADGSMTVGGFFSGFGTRARQHLMRLSSDGTPLSDGLGRVAPNGSVRRMIRHPDGSLWVGGVFTLPQKKLFRITPDFQLDRSFSVTPALDGTISDMVAQADGSVVICGDFRSTDSQNRSRIARLGPNGTLDTVFDAGSGPNDWVRAVRIQADGWIVLGGTFDAVNDTAAPYLARLRSDGTKPVLTSATRDTDGRLSLKLHGNVGSTYYLESSEDLQNWLPVWTNVLTAPSLEWFEPEQSPGQRFYRAIAP